MILLIKFCWKTVNLFSYVQTQPMCLAEWLNALGLSFKKSSLAYTFAAWSGLWLLCVEIILVSIINFAQRVFNYSACERLTFHFRRTLYWQCLYWWLYLDDRPVFKLDFRYLFQKYSLKQDVSWLMNNFLFLSHRLFSLC